MRSMDYLCLDIHEEPGMQDPSTSMGLPAASSSHVIDEIDRLCLQLPSALSFS